MPLFNLLKEMNHMKRYKAFLKRNFLEMSRDPIIYIFCLVFPLLMLSLFQVIQHYTAIKIPTFMAKNLVPGVMVFSYSFVMLLIALLVSKDRKSALLKRLYTSPMKTHEYILGYLTPSYFVALLQSIIILIFSFLLSLVLKETYFSFTKALLLILAMQPILIINLSLGLLLGALLNDKAAPGLTSIFISASGILGGAWMPLDTMGNFEKICLFLPFYPSTYLGRIVVEGEHSFVDANGLPVFYNWDHNMKIGIISLTCYMIISVLGAYFAFNHQMNSDQN